jgi:hypothetical protein
MRMNLFKKSKRFRQDAGVALITSLLLLFLMSSLLVGFSILLISNQQLTGSNNDDVTSFYAAEAGMEQMTANLGDLFALTYSPTIGQVNNVALNPPLLPNIQYLNSNGTSGYTITPAAVDVNGNPAPTVATIKSGPYAGMTAMLTEYTMVVNARTTAGREVKLQRTIQTVGIPMFQFGIFSNTDLSFFPGPNFNFGGRTHTNGNLFLAAGSTVTLADKVDAYKDVIRTNLENGYPTASAYAGTVQITTQPGGTNYRSLGMSEGSLTGTLGSSANSGWPTISTGSAPTDYNSNLINGAGSAYPQYSTGAKQLNLGIVTMGNNTTQSIDLIRRPLSGESANITGERYFAQASLKVLLSDNPADIMNLPCIDGGSQPLDLSLMATVPTANWATYTGAGAAQLNALANALTANGVPMIPLAASGATSTSYTGAYNPNDGYWTPSVQGTSPTTTPWPVIKGYIKIEEQLAYGSPCGTWKDVTAEVLGYGYVGRNINPTPQSWDGATLNPQWPVTSGTQMAPPATWSIPFPPTSEFGFQNGTVYKTGSTLLTSPSTIGSPNSCPDPHPFAVIRLERIRDNPSSIPFTSGALQNKTKPYTLPVQATVAQACGFDPAGTFPVNWQTGGQWAPSANDVWPNTLFDTREGTLRDSAMSATNLPTLNGTMHYIELDGKNLASWFGGKIGTLKTSGQNTRDPNVAPNNFVVYISDRRGNYAGSQTLTGGWPPLSYTKNETGEYGWTDLVNSPANPTTGCPNYSLDTGEDENVGTSFAGQLYTYGAAAQYVHAAGAQNTTANPLGLGQIGVFATLANNGLATNALCAAAPSYVSDGIWPMMVAANTNAARENAPLFFRRAVKIVNANLLTAVGPCPGSVSCGLTIAAENPVYIQGDFNSNSGGNGWGDPSVAASVAGDAVTLLSDQWNDINSFSSPYSLALRNGNTTWYRLAIVGGATNYFPQPSGMAQDYGTDGGVHNFLRYIEAWGGTLEYEGSIVDLYYSRQANGTFKCCTTVYSPPTRGYNFDTNFLNPTLLPPRTPLFRDVNTTGWTRLLLPTQ